MYDTRTGLADDTNLELELAVVHEVLLLKIEVVIRLDLDLVYFLISFLDNKVDHLLNLLRVRSLRHD